MYTRLQERSSEIEQVVLRRISGLSESSKLSDPAYLEDLRTSIAAAVAYGLAVIERGEEHAPPIPAVLLTQARVAARSGVSLDTLLRRYLAGYTLLGDFLIREAEAGDLLQSSELVHLLRTQATRFERLLEAISDEHAREASALKTSTQRRAERIRRLLSGELLDTSHSDYDFEAWHVGAIAAGEVTDPIRQLASLLDCRLLIIPQDERVTWLWFGAQRQLDPSELEHLIISSRPGHICLALGEAAQGLDGWRFTHQQAKAALPIATHSESTLVRYGRVSLLASMLQDDLLVVSLHRLFLAPLDRARSGGDVLRETLCAYFRAERNISSTAAALRVSRQTITNRLSTVEQLLERPLSTCAAEIDAVLQLEALRKADAHQKFRMPNAYCTIP